MHAYAYNIHTQLAKVMHCKVLLMFELFSLLFNSFISFCRSLFSSLTARKINETEFAGSINSMYNM